MFCMVCGRLTEDGKTVCDACAAAKIAQNDLVVQPEPQAAPEQVGQETAQNTNVQNPVQPQQNWQYAQQNPVQPQQNWQYAQQNPVQPQQSWQYAQQNPVQPQQSWQYAQQNPVQPQQNWQNTVPDTFALNQPVKKKSGKGGLIALIVAASVLLAGVLAVVLNWNSLMGFFKQNYSSPQEYMLYVEEQSVSSFANSVSQTYGDVLAGYKKAKGSSAEVDMNIQLGEDLISGIELGLSQSGMDMDLSWLSNILLEIDSNVYQDQMQAELGIGLDGERLLTARLIYDLAQQAAWLGVPELNKQYLSVDMSELTGEDMSAYMEVQIDALQKMLDALPSEEAVDQLLNNYLNIILNRVREVERTKETVTVGGISQEMTVIDARIYEEDMVYMGIDMLEAAEEDQVLRQIIEAFSDFYNDVTRESMREYYAYYGDTYEEVDLYEEFLDWVEDGQEELEYLLEDCDEENYIAVKSYVDGSHSVMGRSIYVNNADMEEISYITVWDGDKFAFEADLAQLQIEGEGSRDGSLLDGTYVVSAMGRKMLTVQVIDFDQKKQDEGCLSGTVKLIPEQGLLEAIGLDDSWMSLINTMEPALELTMNTGEKSSSFDIKIIAKNELMIGLMVSGKISEGKDITLPAGGVDVTDQDALMQWVQALDFEATMQKLENAGVPEELLTMLNYYVSQLQYAGQAW